MGEEGVQSRPGCASPSPSPSPPFSIGDSDNEAACRRLPVAMEAVFGRMGSQLVTRLGRDPLALLCCGLADRSPSPFLQVDIRSGPGKLRKGHQSALALFFSELGCSASYSEGLCAPTFVIFYPHTTHRGVEGDDEILGGWEAPPSYNILCECWGVGGGSSSFKRYFGGVFFYYGGVWFGLPRCHAPVRYRS